MLFVFPHFIMAAIPYVKCDLGCGQENHSKFTFLQAYFCYVFSCSKANFGPPMRKQPHSPHVNHCTVVSPKSHQEPCNEAASQSTIPLFCATLLFVIRCLNFRDFTISFELKKKKSAVVVQCCNHQVISPFIYRFATN